MAKFSKQPWAGLRASNRTPAITAGQNKVTKALIKRRAKSLRKQGYVSRRRAHLMHPLLKLAQIDFER
jgi:hypothetical protein